MQGDILLVNVPGAEHNPRWVVVVSPQDRLGPSGKFFAAGISTDYPNPPLPHQVELPSRPGRHPVTGLTKPCVVKCDWIIELSNSDVVKVTGETPPDQLKLILEQIRKLQA